MPPHADVIELAPDDHQAAAAALARAFHDDPFMIYIDPDDERRRRQLPWFFLTAIKYAARHGKPQTFAGAPEGTALWLPPDQPVPSVFGMIRAGMLALPFRFGLPATLRSMRAANYLEHHHKDGVPARHWYLMTLGIDTERQGQGLGGALIAPALERADRDRLPCYLETMKERNVTFYRKHGFDVVTEGELPSDGPHYWTMRREPIG